MKTRGMGSLFRFKRTINGQRVEAGHWWLKFYYRGPDGRAVVHRESSHSPVRKVAVSLLKQRLGEMGRGTFRPDAEKLTFEDLAKMLKDDYVRNGRKSWERAAR